MHNSPAPSNPPFASSGSGDNPDVLHINISPETIARIKERVEFTAKHALIGQIQGANPAQRDLQHWAEDNLPRSFDRLVVKGRGFFEVQFSTEDGRTEALSKTSYKYQGRPVTFKVWTPHFKPDDEVDKPQLKFPVWVQINELPMVFRTSDYLEEVVSHFAQVVMVEDSTEYRARFMGPRVRILTNNVDSLPKKITLPRWDGTGQETYVIEYSGLPEQCTRCRSFEHTVPSISKLIPPSPVLDKELPQPSQDSKPESDLKTYSRRTKIKDNSQRPAFVWGTRTIGKSPAEQVLDSVVEELPFDSSGKRVYRSTDLSKTFFETLGMDKIPACTTLRGAVIPVFYRWSASNFQWEYICERDDKKLRPITIIQVSELKLASAIKQNTKFTRSQITNDVFMELRSLISNFKDGNHPLASWESATWMYYWSENEPNSQSTCKIFTMMNSSTKRFTFRGKRQFRWRKMPQEIVELLTPPPYHLLNTGIGGVHKRNAIRELFSHLTPKPDILLLQEHRFSASDCIRKTKQLDFLKGPTFWNEAIYNVVKDTYKGGTAILLSSKFNSQIVTSGIIVPGHLWATITSTPVPDATWILCGDFNVVDRLEDRIGGLPSTGMRAAEMLSWNNMLLHFRVSDSFLLPEFRNVTNKIYSWDNGQMGNRRLASRIDRIYIPQEIQVLGGQCGIWPSYRKISDHSAYFVKIHDRDVEFPKRTHFNKALLDTPDSRQTLVDAWKSAIEEDPSRSWAEKLQHALTMVKRTSDSCTEAKSQQWKATYDAEIHDILEAEELLHGDWENDAAREQLAAAQLKLQEIRQARLEKRINKMGARWTKLGDRFKIKELVRDQRVITDQKELNLYATQFYRALYTEDPEVEQNQTARNSALRSVQRVVTDEQNQLLTAPFSMLYQEESSHPILQLHS
ncbi:hypothetical protein KC19_1G100600 [Ceratodon purpureus]|uniref:Endonuclease/exonuclease/phosphatase domain-containing protein n=1 Tax=Ceratodon purpureus TaxID=3225 RepID=A0A8T0J3G0_CERPU|nr:hypothetical protein KC19_1G100600 [Ceratodon purpureus]